MSLRRIKLTKLNEHLVCILCHGYFVEATTITECLHTFCRSCIVDYLKNNSFCPVCDVQVHKTKPISGLREDKTLQDIVFKLVPNLFQNEMERRTMFYHEHPEAGGDRTELSLKERRHFFHVDDQISLSLEFLPPAHAHAHALGLRAIRAPSYGLSHPPEALGTLGKDETPIRDGESPVRSEATEKEDENRAARDGCKLERGTAEGGKSRPKKDIEKVRVPLRRYLKCSAAAQIWLLEKFIRLKYNLTPQHRIDIVHAGDCLSPELTLLDVVYMYKWTEDNPLKLQYTVLAPPLPLRKRPRLPMCKSKASGDSSPKKRKLEEKNSSVSPVSVKHDSKESKQSPSKPVKTPEEENKVVGKDEGVERDVKKENRDKDITSEESNSLNSSRDDGEDAMVIDESATTESSDGTTDRDLETNSLLVDTNTNSSITNSNVNESSTVASTSSSISSIESLKSLVNSSGYPLPQKSSQLASTIQQSSGIQTSQSKCDIISSASQNSKVSSSQTCNRIATTSVTLCSTNTFSTISSIANNVGKSMAISSLPHTKPLQNFTSATPQSTVSTNNNINTSLISTTSSASTGNVKPNQIFTTLHSGGVGSSVRLPQPAKTTSIAPAPTVPTSALKTPLLSTRQRVPSPGTAIVATATSAMIPKSSTPSTPRNLISNSYRANLPMNNDPRMNGMLHAQRPIVEPKLPTLGRPRKSSKITAPPAGRYSSANNLPRALVPSAVYMQKGVSNFDGRGRPKIQPMPGIRRATPVNSIRHQPILPAGQMTIPVSQAAQQLIRTLATNGNQDIKMNNGNNVMTSVANSIISENKELIKNNTIVRIPQGQNPIQNGYPTSTAATDTNLHHLTVNANKRTAVNGSPNLKLPSVSSSSNIAGLTSTRPKVVAGAKSIKSPGGRGKQLGGNSANILDIAESLVNKKLQEITQNSSSVYSPVVASTPTAISTNPSVLNQALGLSGIPPALQAAYMADYAAVHNLLSLGQAAVRMNMAMNCLQDPSEKSDSTPMDLSPTNKGAPSSSLSSPKHSSIHKKSPAVSKTQDTKTGIAASPKTVASIAFPSPRSVHSPSPATKAPQPPSSTSPSIQSNNRTISPPTAEVTITKLPNSTSESPVASLSTLTTSTKPSHTNTVSITKRPTTISTPTSGSKFPCVTRSPANASVRQIPNPSFLSHQSEARNNHSAAPKISAPATKAPKSSQPAISSTYTNNNNCNNANMNKALKVDS